MKVFGREPAVFVAILEAVLAFLVTLPALGLTPDGAHNILAVGVAVGGVLTAWTTRETLLSALVGLGQAIVILLVGAGLNLNEQQIGLLVGVMVTVVAVFGVRPQNSPVETPISSGAPA
jgi:hypothetical protein